MKTPKLHTKKAKKIQENIASWFGYWRPNNVHYVEMMEFVQHGLQWNDELSKGMKESETHMFTLNLLRKVANSVIGESQQNTPDIHVSPLNDEAQQNNAQLIQNILRTFIIEPDTKEAEQTAFMCQTVGGYGALRLSREYEDKETDNQKIVVDTVYDPTHCFWDPSAKKSHKGDGKFCGYYGTLSRKEFEKKYKDADWPEAYSIPDCEFSWVSEDEIVTVHYFEKKITKKTLFRLADDTFMLEDDYKELSEYQELPEVVSEREVEDITIKEYEFVGDYLIEETDFPGEMLPLVFGGGANTYELKGRQHIRSFFADAVDSQVYANYLASRSIDLVKKYDPNQWISPVECVSNHKQYWEGGAKVAGVKPYDVYVDEGGNVHTPTKVNPSVLPQHFFEQSQKASNDIYNIIGVYETQLGAQGNEMSGAAIDARTGRGNNNTYVLFNANNRLINRMAAVMLSMLPTVYGSKRIMSIDTQEYGAQQVTLNNPVNEYETENDITRGNYKVVARASSSFEAQKRQNIEMLLEVCRSMGVINTPYGQFTGAQLFADNILENIPMNGANELSNRVRVGIPEQIIAAGKGQKVEPPQPQPNPQEELMKKKMQLEEMKIQAGMQSTQTGVYIAKIKAAAEVKNSELKVQAAIANTHTKMHDNDTKKFESILRRHDAAAHRSQPQQQ